jgi:hypothetical protein
MDVIRSTESMILGMAEAKICIASLQAGSEELWNFE